MIKHNLKFLPRRDHSNESIAERRYQAGRIQGKKLLP